METNIKSIFPSCNSSYFLLSATYRQWEYECLEETFRTVTVALLDTIGIYLRHEFNLTTSKDYFLSSYNINYCISVSDAAQGKLK